MNFALSIVALVAFTAALAVETAIPASALFGIHIGRHGHHHHHRRPHHTTHRAHHR